MQDFRNLKVWDRSHQLVLNVYRITRKFPKEEIYGLTSQVRRAAVSIPSNIAEGCGRYGDQEFSRFIQIAIASSNEVDYQLLLAKELAYISDSDYNVLEAEVNQVRQMLISLNKTLKKQAIKLVKDGIGLEPTAYSLEPEDL
jgi:four helix bundle protein